MRLYGYPKLRMFEYNLFVILSLVLNSTSHDVILKNITCQMVVTVIKNKVGYSKYVG